MGNLSANECTYLPTMRLILIMPPLPATTARYSVADVVFLFHLVTILGVLLRLQVEEAEDRPSQSWVWHCPPLLSVRRL